MSPPRGAVAAARLAIATASGNLLAQMETKNSLACRRRQARVLVLLTMITGALHADDWPQWLGPKRDAVWRETGIVEKLPADGLKYRWRMPVGGGYSGPAVARGRVYVMDRQLAQGA